MDAGPGEWAMRRRAEPGGGAAGRGAVPVSPDRVVLRSYGLRAVLGLGGGGKARGVSGLNGESPTLGRLLGTHVQAPGRSARGVVVRPLSSRRAPPARARPPGRCSPARGRYRGRSQAGSSCPSPGRGRTLRSRGSRAGVCGAPEAGRRGGGLHCDPGRGVLTSQSLFLPPENPLSPRVAQHLARAPAGNYKSMVFGERVAQNPRRPGGGAGDEGYLRAGSLHEEELGIPGPCRRPGRPPRPGCHSLTGMRARRWRRLN